MKRTRKPSTVKEPRDDTSFSRKWGISAYKLAEQEDVSGAAIHMRVWNWGNPFRRKSKPTKFEAQYGFTQAEMALKYGIHPFTIETRLARGQDPVADADPQIQKLPPEQRARAAVNPDVSKNTWNTYRKILRADTDFWLHPKHPAYARARAGNLTPEDIKEIQAHG